MIKPKQIVTQVFTLVILTTINISIFQYTRIYHRDIIFCNQDGSWGIIQNKNLLVLGTAGLLFFLAYFWLKAKEKMSQWGFVLIIAGGAGNLYERIVYGCVADYIKVFSWYPSFNLADCLVVAGAALLLIKQLRIKKEELRNKI